MVGCYEKPFNRRFAKCCLHCCLKLHCGPNYEYLLQNQPTFMYAICFGESMARPFVYKEIVRNFSLQKLFGLREELLFDSVILQVLSERMQAFFQN